MYDYLAKVLKVVDGDTLHLDLDLGCDTHLRMTVRLVGIDTPEMNTSEGIVARDYVRMWVEQFGGNVRVMTVKDKREKYGRYLVRVFPPPSSIAPNWCLNDDLVEKGFAVIYAGGPK